MSWPVIWIFSKQKLKSTDNEYNKYGQTRRQTRTCYPKTTISGVSDDVGWDRDILGNLFAERSKKNNPEKTVLAATQDKGVIPYELMDKSVIRDRKNLGGYKLVLPEDFVISLRSFEGGFEYSNMKDYFTRLRSALSKGKNMQLFFPNLF